MITPVVLRQVVHQPCHHNLREMCRITPGQWEQKGQARGDVTNVGKIKHISVTVQVGNIKLTRKPTRPKM